MKKILILFIILFLCSAKVSAIGIEVIYYASNVNETEVKVQIEISLTSPYVVYENDSKITNGTLIAYTLTNITTARNTTPNVIIQHSLFINWSTEEYSACVWLNFSYSNFPVITEFKMKTSVMLIVIVGMLSVLRIKQKKRKNTG